MKTRHVGSMVIWTALYRFVQTALHKYGGNYFVATGLSLTSYVKLRVAHAPGMPGTFFPPPRVSDTAGTCVTHVPWCLSGSLTNGFLWSRWRGKRSQHSRRMRNSQFYVSGNRPIETSSEEKTWCWLDGISVPWWPWKPTIFMLPTLPSLVLP